MQLAARPARDGGVDVDGDTLDQLRALGYANEGEALPEGAEVGVVHHDPDSAVAGLTLYTDAKACETHLVDMEGRSLHRWTGTPCYRWDNNVLLANGDLLVTTRERKGDGREDADSARYLIRLSWDGDEIWRLPLRVHHDVDWTPGGEIIAMTHRFRRLPSVHPDVPVRDHTLTRLTSDGRRVEVRVVKGVSYCD